MSGTSSSPSVSCELRGLLVVLGVLAGGTLGAQAPAAPRGVTPAPTRAASLLPARSDTFRIATDSTAVGRGIRTWTTLGLEHLQVFVFQGAAGEHVVVDSLFSDPTTLLPIRETRVVADTSFLVHYGRDSLFISRIVGAEASTSHAVAPTVDLHSALSLPMLAATMPFRASASRSVLLYHAPPARLGPKWVVLFVDGRVTLNGRTAWRVFANTQTGTSSTFWVDEATRRILQEDHREGNAVVTYRRQSP
jgi:hypothetical protein